jgi:hypothetical protein
MFIDADKRVSFAYPDKRMLATGKDNPYLVVTVTSPDIGEYTPSFNVTKEQIDTDTSLDTYVSKTMNQLRSAIAEFKQDDVASIDID